METLNQPLEVSNTPNLISSLQSISKKASIAVVVIGGIVFLGWMLNIDTLKSLLPGLVSMKTNTALGFLFGGASLWLWHEYPTDQSKQRWAQICGGIVALIGLLTLMQYGFGWDLGIDQLIFKEPTDAVFTSAPNRMAVNTAFNFLLTGSALLLINNSRPNYAPAQIFSLVAFIIALLGLIGYSYRVSSFYGFGSYTRMALHTAVGFVLMSVAILGVRPDAEIMSVFTAPNAGGLMARQLTPAAIAIPPILGWLIISGYRSKSFDPEIAIALFGVLNIIVFGLVTWWNARTIGALDIKRQLAEEELRSLNEQLEQRIQERTLEVIDSTEERDRFFTLSLDLLCVAGFDGDFKRLNPAWEKTLGYKADEMIGKPFMDFIHPDDREATANEAAKIADGATLIHFENRYRCKDGSYRWLSWSAAPYIANESIYAIAYDITETKRTQVALRESQERLQAILDNCPAVIYLKDKQGRYVLVNGRYETVFHISKEEIIGKTDYEVFSKEMADSFRANDLKVLETGTSLELEEVAPQEDGLHTYFSVKFPLKDTKGVPNSVCGISTDITERKQTEAYMRQSEERYRSLVVATSQMVWSTDAEGKVVDMPSWRAFTGQTPEEVKGFRWLEALHPDDRDRTAKIWMKAIENKSLYETEYRIRAANGEYRYFAVRGTPILEEDNSIREWIGVCSDINDRKQAEAELARSEAEIRQQSSILQLVLNSMGDAVLVADENGKFLLFNPAAEEMLGVGAIDNSAPSKWSQDYGLFLDDGKTPYPAADVPLARTLRGESVDDVEIFSRHAKKPQGMWLKINGRPLKDETGVLRGGVVVTRDVTSDRLAQERLKQLAEEQERLLQELKNRQNALDESAIVSETDVKGTITFANDRFCQISGYKREELIGQNHRLLNSGYHPTSFFKDMWATISSGGVWKAEIKNKTKNGSFYWVDSTIAPIFDPNGKIIKYISIRFDTTERKLAEERIAKQAEERKAEADSLTQQVLKLLNEIKGAAKGDLTVKAQVNNDILGAVADSFNFLISSLRKVVNGIQDVAKQVTTATSVSINDTSELAKQARTQAEQIDIMLQQIERIVNSIKDVSDVAKRAEKVAEQAAQTAEAGGVAVDRTVEGINELRQTIAQTSKMMKRLGESSQQIGKIITSISQIAAQTNLLALNATIEAARAGEHGQGFAVVADEVRKLAERSASATEEISDIVNTIKDEIGRVMVAMESGTQEVVEGTQLAAEAKTNLVAIIEVSREINGLIQNITRAAQKQVTFAEQISGSMQQVNNISTTTAEKAEDLTASLDGLSVAVNKLQGSVSNFRS